MKYLKTFNESVLPKPVYVDGETITRKDGGSVILRNRVDSPEYIDFVKNYAIFVNNVQERFSEYIKQNWVDENVAYPTWKTPYDILFDESSALLRGFELQYGRKDGGLGLSLRIWKDMTITGRMFGGYPIYTGHYKGATDKLDVRKKYVPDFEDIKKFLLEDNDIKKFWQEWKDCMIYGEYLKDDGKVGIKEYPYTPDFNNIKKYASDVFSINSDRIQPKSK